MNQIERTQLEELITYFFNSDLKYAILSNPVSKDQEFLKIKIRPLMIQNKIVFQAEEFIGKQAFHKNLAFDEIAKYLTEQLNDHFRQLEIQSAIGSGHVLISKKGKATIKIKKDNSNHKDTAPNDLSHNRAKKYILQEGIAVPFLIDLGIMTQDGTIVRTKYDKYRQINRFLEFIEDILPKLSKERENVIIDFGCGKSYLTFAMYYYLKILKEYPIRIIGLDLKEDVINKCNQLKERYDYQNLDFLIGDIASYDGVKQVDMVVTLHACDTATDYALAKAVKWGAGVILSVPCCQHELNSQIKNTLMEPIFQYGIIKERMASLYTDAIRAQLLEGCGYHTQLLEFIDMEHTPKNILIRAVKQGKPKQNQQQLDAVIEFLQVNPTLKQLLS